MEELLTKVKALDVKSMKDLDLDLEKQASNHLQSIFAELEQMKGNVVTIQIGSYIRYEFLAKHTQHTHSHIHTMDTADPERHPLPHLKIE